MGKKKKQPKATGVVKAPVSPEVAKLSRFGKVLLRLKKHPFAVAVAIVLPATPFIYQVGGDILDGKWFGEITLYLHSERLEKSVPVYIFYTSPRVLESERIIVPVDVTIFNDSKKVAKVVNLSLKYLKASDRDKIPEYAQTHSGEFVAADTLHETNSNDSYIYSNYRTALMPPEHKSPFSDGAFAVPGFSAKDTPVYMSSGLGLDVKVSLFSETQSATEWDLRYRGIVAKDNNAVGDWIKEDYGPYIAIDTRRKSGFWRYLWGWVVSEKIEVFSFSTDFRFESFYKSYVPSNKTNGYKLYRFSPYVKELILGVN